MLVFVAGLAAGYVLGARAGRERYEQIVRMYHQVVEHRAVQRVAERISGHPAGDPVIER